MRLTIQKTPYSSIVGGGLTLCDEAGRARFLVMFCGTTAGITKEETAALTEQFADALPNGIDVPDRLLAEHGLTLTRTDKETP